ncbi:MAG: site-2 protease family protein [Pseudomonadota bacterium]|jgi:Zn-dependent protease|nr:site-2 protease family protein [Alphaproteobacteria bacterium]
MADLSQFLLKILCLIVSIVLHEIGHGLMAYVFGDRTAQQAGRLSANPFSHIDPLGSLVLPFLLFVTNAPFLIGWAKPVPVNFTNLRPQTLGVFLVAFAGPLTNIILALFAGILWKIGIFNDETMNTAVQINVILAAFNLLPILPLDGGRIVTCFLSQSHPIFHFFERFGLLIIIGALTLFNSFFHKIIFIIANIILNFLNKLI